MQKNNIGIYVHIPFCKKKCYYCDFLSFENKMQCIDKYINILKKEIEKESICNKADTIYIGGGTPSIIDSKYITEILKIIKCKFNVMGNAEITIEINPGTINIEKLKDYYNAGINRISIGMQSTENETLKRIGRIHTDEQFLETYELARDIGFNNINIDVIIALPNQKLDDMKKIVNRIKKINPEHVSIYSLILEENTVLKDKYEKNEIVLPSDDDERKMYWYVKSELEKMGFIHYEISNFAKKGKESKHNLNCWNQKEYIGFGLGAHSYINGKRYSNTRDFEKYIKNFNNTREVHETQNEEDMQKEFILLGLRKIEGIKISDFINKFNVNPIEKYKKILEKLKKEKLIDINNENIKLSNKGIDLANIVWEEFV